MRSPQAVLNTLRAHSAQTGYVYQRLYRNLFNQDLFLQAYQNIYANPGNMTAGADGQTIDAMSIARINRLISSLKTEQYHPYPSRRTYIPKKNGKMRPLGIPSVDDKLVQECVRMLLEAIYEDSFEDTSHGFRPDRSCHTALLSLQNRFVRCRWFVEGDIKGFFDHIDHKVLMNLLRKRIQDERFLRLIQKFLKAGYIEEWEKHNTYSGTPQGGIISPILANIYLDQLDKYVVELKQRFDSGRKRAVRKEYARLTSRRAYLSRCIRNTTGAKREAYLLSIKQLDKILRQTKRSDPMDGCFKRLQYVRYADDFIIGVIGSKEDARCIKAEIGSFLSQQLHLELSEEKTLITKSTRKARFLGYDVRTTPYTNLAKKDVLGRYARNYGGNIHLEVPTELVRKKLLSLGAMKIQMCNGVERWRPAHRKELIARSDLSILDQYNSEVRGLCNYYSIANNRSKLHYFRYVMKYSMVRTYCCKYRCTKGKIFRKYYRNGVFGVNYVDKQGNQKLRAFWSESLKRETHSRDASVDLIHKPKGVLKRAVLAERLRRGYCEWCGKQTQELEVHHVRNLNRLPDTCEWMLFMKKINRKTLVVCEDCHKMIHSNG